MDINIYSNMVAVKVSHDSTDMLSKYRIIEIGKHSVEYQANTFLSPCIAAVVCLISCVVIVVVAVVER